METATQAAPAATQTAGQFIKKVVSVSESMNKYLKL